MDLMEYSLQKTDLQFDSTVRNIVYRKHIYGLILQIYSLILLWYLRFVWFNRFNNQ